MADAFKNVRVVVLNYKGEVVTDVTADAVKPDTERKKQNAARASDSEELWAECRFPVYILEKDGKAEAYCIPVLGFGLWGALYGYFALEKDLDTVLGITFYKTKETPGLGKEIEYEYYQKKFLKKKILDAKGKLRSITVVKGKASDKYDLPELNHYVDGISGATITCDGVTDMLKKFLDFYQPYFKNERTAQ